MIKLYTFPTCPKCRIVKKKLEAVNLEYDLIEDENKTTEFANSIGIKEVPIMVVNEQPMNFTQTIRWLADYKAGIVK